jgi:hypothetical protein
MSSGAIDSQLSESMPPKGLFGVLRRDQAYRSLAYLAVSAVLGWLYILLLSGLQRASTQWGLLVFVFLMAAVLASSWFAAMFERALAIRLLRIHIPPMTPPTAPDLYSRTG